MPTPTTRSWDEGQPRYRRSGTTTRERSVTRPSAKTPIVCVTVTIRPSTDRVARLAAGSDEVAGDDRLAVPGGQRVRRAPEHREQQGHEDDADAQLPALDERREALALVAPVRGSSDVVPSDGAWPGPSPGCTRALAARTSSGELVEAVRMRAALGGRRCRRRRRRRASRLCPRGRRSPATRARPAKTPSRTRRPCRRDRPSRTTSTAWCARPPMPVGKAMRRLEDAQPAGLAAHVDRQAAADASGEPVGIPGRAEARALATGLEGRNLGEVEDVERRRPGRRRRPPRAYRFVVKFPRGWASATAGTESTATAIAAATSRRLMRPPPGRPAPTAARSAGSASSARTNQRRATSGLPAHRWRNPGGRTSTRPACRAAGPASSAPPPLAAAVPWRAPSRAHPRRRPIPLGVRAAGACERLRQPQTVIEVEERGLEFRAHAVGGEHALDRPTRPRCCSLPRRPAAS